MSSVAFLDGAEHFPHVQLTRTAHQSVETSTEKSLQLVSLLGVFFRIFADEPSQVEQFPAHRRKVGRARPIDSAEIRSAVMHAELEPFSVLVEARLDVHYQFLASRKQFIKADRCPGHALELSGKGLIEINRIGIQQFVRRTRGARNVDQERAKQIVRQPFVLVEQFCIVKVTGVLAIHRGMLFATKQVFERDDLHFRKAERVCDLFGYRADFWVMDDTARDRRCLDLDLDTIQACKHTGCTAPATEDALRPCALAPLIPSSIALAM